MRESQNDIEAVAVYRFWTSPESVVKPSIADASAGQRSSSLVACMGPPPGASDGSGVGDAVGLFRWPEAPIWTRQSREYANQHGASFSVR